MQGIQYYSYGSTGGQISPSHTERWHPAG